MGWPISRGYVRFREGNFRFSDCEIFLPSQSTPLGGLYCNLLLEGRPKPDRMSRVTEDVKKNQPGWVRFVWWGFLSGKGELRLVVHPRFFQGFIHPNESKWWLFRISEPATVHLPTFFITFHVTQIPSRSERNRSRVQTPMDTGMLTER